MVYESRDLPSFVQKKNDTPQLENLFEVRTTFTAGPPLGVSGAETRRQKLSPCN
jgi:hypothetical protein